MFAIKSLFALLSVVALATTQIVAERSMRILLNNGEESSHGGCNAADVDIIKESLWHEEYQKRGRNLQYGPFDCPCDDECEGWPPHYCFWFFCEWVNRRSLAEGQEETESVVPLGECADHVVDVNNVLNAAIPLVSEDCQAILMANRSFQCQ